MAERLDEDWAPVILEGIHSVKIEDGEPVAGPSSSKPPTRKLEDAIKHILREFYSFTNDDFRKIDIVLANPRIHHKLEPALVSGGVEEEKASLFSSWILGTLPSFA